MYCLFNKIYCVIERERDRDRETETERDRERETEREADRDRETERDKDTQRDRQTERLRGDGGGTRTRKLYFTKTVVSKTCLKQLAVAKQERETNRQTEKTEIGHGSISRGGGNNGC